MERRGTVYALGAGLGLLIVFLIGVVKGSQDWSFAGGRPIFLPLSCGALALWIAESKGIVKSKADLDRPLTLFGDSDR